ncbi:hypothetical protein FBU31_003197 [Coemansia sp. 'formosensis']|nr:hypothetical protein FBU31_003197 [Coemansia sp. 'formosensis']
MHSGKYNGAAEGPPHQQQQQQRQQQQYRQYQQPLPLPMQHSHQAVRQNSDPASSAQQQQLLHEPAHMRAPMSATLGENTMMAYRSGVPPYQAGIPGVAEITGSAFSHHAGAEYGGGSNVYPSTLLPSRQIQAQHHHHQQVLHQHLDFAPVRLLQSCDSCRRRKIRCSGEKPTCSSCVRYQEICHYSPLATPRRRAGKRARTGEPETSHEPMPTTPTTAGATGAVAAEMPREESVAPSHSAPLSADVEALSGGEFVPWSTEASQMRRDIEGLSRKFDSLNGKLDQLIGLVGKQQQRRRRRRRQRSESASSTEHMEYSQNESAYNSHDEQGDAAEGGQAASVSTEFCNLIDRTSRFGIDATNVGIISGMINSIDGARSAQQGAESVRVAAKPSGPSLSGTQGVEQRLETKALRAELIDTFYEHADVNTISFIPRHIFQLLQREQRTPTAMTNVMMADACGHSDNADLMAVGREFARGYFIERAYCALFECLEYDSAEHCVALLLFAMVISKAGLHRAWIMHSLSTQMAIRLRFNTLDSPISAPAFKNDSELTREWKRRVFWQLYTFDILTTTLSDLPPCLSIHDLRCNAPTPLTDDVLASMEGGSGKQLAVLGPAVVFCDDQMTMREQTEMLGILCDISSLQNMMTPEVCLFPADFMLTHERILAWQRHMPHYDVFARGNLTHIAEVFQQRPGLIFLGLLSQYAQIFLCLIKDTWLPRQRKMTADEENTLAWARQTAYESAQVVHRLVPFIRGMRLNTVCPFILCVVFQACIVSLYSCGWSNVPRRILAAVNSMEAGLDFLEFVTPRWAFAGVLTTSLRGLIVERGFGPKDQSDNADTNERQPQADAAAGERAVSPPPPIELMRPFLEESPWERILRTGEVPPPTRN